MPTTIASRCWRFQAFTDLGAVPRFEFMRESIADYGNGDVVHRPLPTVARSIDQVATLAIAGGPVVCNTMADVLALVAACGHQLAAIDDAAIAAAKLAAEQEAAARAAAAAAAATPTTGA